MSTYISGVTDYIPQIQPYQPDYNVLGNVLQTEQGRYDASHKQISSAYGTLLSSPMLRDDNIQRRDAFFKSIDRDIKKVSGMDLSLQQNVDSAMKIFKPLYEDKGIIKDMTWTKNWQNQLQRGEAFRTCIDPDKCGGRYWEGGTKALQYRADEFRKADPGTAMNMENASYVPSIDVMGKAMKSAKEAGFKISLDTTSGGYIVTTVNGDKMVAPLTSYFMSKFGGDPGVMDYYKTQAYLQRKDFVSSNAMHLGGEDQANMEYVKNLYGMAGDSIKKGKEKADNDTDAVKTFKDAYSTKIEREGVLPTDSKTIDEWNTINDQHTIALQSQQAYTTANDVLENAGINADNIKYMGDRVDQLLGFSMLTKELGNAAKAYADLTMERSIKADPYGLQAREHSFQMNKMGAEKAMDFDYWKQKEQYKAGQEKAKWDQILGEGTFKPGKGDVTPVTDPNMAYNNNTKEEVQISKNLQGGTSNFLVQMANTMHTQYGNSKNQKVLLETAKQVFEGSGIDASKILSGDIKEMDKLKTMGYGESLKLYNKSVNVVAPHASITGPLNSDWNKEFWGKTLELRNNIKTQVGVRQEMIKHFEGQSQKVTDATAGQIQQEASAKGDPSEGTRKVALLNIMTDMEHQGFLSPVDTDPHSADLVARKFAQEHQDEFGAGKNYTSPSMTSATGSPVVATGANQVINNDGYSAAYNFAQRNLKDIATTWKNNYKDHAVAWNQEETFGTKRSNGEMGGGYEYRMDAAAPGNPNTVRFSELARNYNNIDNEAIIKFEGSTGAETDSAAKKIADQYINDFFKPSTIKDGNRPRGKYDVQRIADYNKDYMSFTIYPDETWAGQSKLRGGKANPGITYSHDYQNGITIMIPASKADNSYYKDSQYTPEDMLLNKTGKLTFDEFPGGGKISVTKVGTEASGKQYAISGQMKVVNQDGNTELVPIDNVVSGDLSANIIMKDWNAKLNTIQTINENTLNALRHTKGNKNPQSLLKQVQ